MTKSTSTELLEARVAAEQQWIYDRHLAGCTRQSIRELACRPVEAGGLGRIIAHSEIRSALDAIRTSQGSIIGNKEERVERYTARYEEQIELGLAARARAAVEERIDYDAEKLIANATAALAKLHGDDAAQRIEAEVTTRDAASAELDAMLARLDAEATV